MAISCPGLITGPSAGSQIENHLSTVLNYGNESYNTALEAINSINALFAGSISSVGASAGSTRPSDDVLELPDFVKPDLPEDPALVFQPPTDLPSPPDYADIDTGIVGNAPTFTASAPSINLPPQPDALSATPPADPAPIQYPEYPADPDIELPAVPTLYALNLPTLVEPDIETLLADLQTLRDEKPETPDVFLQENFLSDIDNQYSVTKSRLASYIGECPAFEKVCTNLSTLLSGESTGLPANVEQTLRDRAFQAQDRQSFQEERQVNDEFLSRGFTLPNAILLNRLDLVRQQTADRKQALNRDIFIQAAQWEIENLRFAIQQGIAYEGMYRDSWFRLYDLSRNIAAQTFEIQYRILEARINVYRAALEGWRQEFETFRIWLEAELANIEIYRQKLEAQRLIQGINQQEIDIYRARLQGVQSEVDVYRARIEAANSQLQGELAKIEVHKSQVQAYAAQVGAYEAEWRGYGEAVQGELGKTEIYKALVEAYAQRVNAYRTENEAKRINGEFQVDVYRLRLESYRTRLEKFQADLQGEVARIESGARIFGAKTQLYNSEVRAETASTGLASEEARLKLQRYVNDANIAVEEARLEIQNTLGTLQATVTALDGVARTGSQLAASAMSSLNMGASISESTSYGNSRGCSTTYSGDI